MNYRTFIIIPLITVLVLAIPCSAKEKSKTEQQQKPEKTVTSEDANINATSRDRSENSRGLFKDIVKGALLFAGNSVLGPNITNALRPIARPIVDRIVPEDDFGSAAPSPPPASTDDKQDQVTALDSSAVPSAPSRPCTTPQKGPGECKDIAQCPTLLFDLTNLRNSICFQDLFLPGVCCPSAGVVSIPPVTRPTRRPVRPSRPVVRPPAIRPPTPARPTSRPRPITRPTVAQTRPPPIAVTPPPITPANDYPCGQPKSPESRVVGGDVSRPGQWPWMAAIYLHGNNRREYWCGGSLISKRYIMTAAHCTKDSRGKNFHPRQFTVRLGDSNLRSASDNGATAIYRVTEYVAHPEFKLSGYYNDLALFKLNRDVNFNDFVIPVCLPNAYEKRPIDALVGRSAHVIGWGVTKYGGEESPDLRSADLPVWRQKDCDNAYFQPIRQMFICAGYADGRKDACQGDSGGPLVYLERGSYMQIGIVSFGNRCAQPGYPGVYTRITNFLPWIRQNLI